MKRSAGRKKVNKGVLATIGAAFLGVLAGAATMFLSEKGNREAVKKTVNNVVKKGKVEVAMVKRKVATTKNKLNKKK